MPKAESVNRPVQGVQWRSTGQRGKGLLPAKGKVVQSSLLYPAISPRSMSWAHHGPGQPFSLTFCFPVTHRSALPNSEQTSLCMPALCRDPAGKGVALRECESALWYKHPTIVPTAGAVTIWACFQCNRLFCVIQSHSK